MQITIFWSIFFVHSKLAIRSQYCNIAKIVIFRINNLLKTNINYGQFTYVDSKFFIIFFIKASCIIKSCNKPKLQIATKNYI